MNGTQREPSLEIGDNVVVVVVAAREFRGSIPNASIFPHSCYHEVCSNIQAETETVHFPIHVRITLFYFIFFLYTLFLVFFSTFNFPHIPQNVQQTVFCNWLKRLLNTIVFPFPINEIK